MNHARRLLNMTLLVALFVGTLGGALGGTHAGAAGPNGAADLWNRAVRDVSDALARATAPRRNLTIPPGVYLLLDETVAGQIAWDGLDRFETAPERVVLLVHGLDETGQIWDELAPALQQHGHRVGRFEYPNDGSIEDASRALDAELQRLHQMGTERVDLVGHSMGGLVCRDLLTRADGYRGSTEGHTDRPDIRRLVLVATPNLGSPLAGMRGTLEVRERWVRWMGSDSIDPRDLLAFDHDGQGDAGDQLRPGSDFLLELNARPAPAPVRTTVIVGTVGELRPSAHHPDAPPTLVVFGQEAPTPPWLRALGSKVGDRVGDGLHARLGTEAERALRLLGDGAVPHESALLPGIEDTVVLHAGHRGLLARDRIEGTIRRALELPAGEPPAIAVILDRLDRPEPRTKR